MRLGGLPFSKHVILTKFVVVCCWVVLCVLLVCWFVGLLVCWFVCLFGSLLRLHRILVNLSEVQTLVKQLLSFRGGQSGV